MEDILKDELMKLAETCSNMDKLVRSLGYENTQWFIEWQNKINEVSVR